MKLVRATAIAALVVSGVTFFCNLVPAQELGGSTEIDPLIQMEIEYASRLSIMGMPDYAKMVLDRIKDPSVLPKIKALEMQALVTLGKWDEVKARIAAEPDQFSSTTWAMRLALADGYYAWGKYPEARAIYDDMFRKYSSGPPAELKEFYFNAAYKYAQMLILIGKRKDAIEAYRKILDSKPEKDVKRQIMAEIAEQMITLIESGGISGSEQAYYKSQIEEYRKQLMWIQDLWYAKSLVIHAHLLMIDGKFEEAMKIIENYRKNLEEMDKVLRDEEEKTGQPLIKLSPMAECRYLLGKVLQKEAERLIASGGNKEQVKMLLVGKPLPNGERLDGALQHFFKVFVQYPSSSWAPDAGSRAKQVKALVEREFGVNINVEVSPEQWTKVEKEQFKEARTLFNQNQFEKAMDSYVKVLNLFPEGEVAVSALAELVQCYVELKEEVYADVVTSYIADRFGKRPAYFTRAGEELVKIANLYGERKAPKKKAEVMDMFFLKVPRHPKVPAMIMKRADEKAKEKDFAGAANDYSIVEERYPEYTYYADALNKKSVCLMELGETIDGIKALTKYVEIYEKKDVVTQELLVGKFRLAQAYRQLEAKYIPTAFKYYAEIVKLMTDTNNPVVKSLTTKDESISKLLEGAYFYQAMCYIKLDQPPENVKAYRMQAIKLLENLVDKFPKSEFVPSALLQIGTLYTVLDDAENAQKALQKLQKDYGNTPEANNSYFILGMNLLKMDRKKEARVVFKQMFEGGGKYPDKQILAAAKEILEAGDYEIAFEAYDRLKDSKDKDLEEAILLGRGKCLYGLKKPAESVEVLEGMIKKYPKSGYTIEVAKTLTKAYGDLGMEESDAEKRKLLFNKAVIWERKTRLYEKGEDQLCRSNVRVGRLQVKKALAEEKFGSKESALEYKGEAAATFLTIIMSADSKDARIALALEDAYVEVMPLLYEIERYAEMAQYGEKYLAEFERGKNISTIRSWLTKARVKLVAVGGEAVPEDAGDGPVPIGEQLGEPAPGEADSEDAVNEPETGSEGAVGKSPDEPAVEDKTAEEPAEKPAEEPEAEAGAEPEKPVAPAIQE